MLSGNGLFYEFDYKRVSKNDNVALAPIVEVRLKSRNNLLGIVINEFGLIDTGADVTLVPMFMIAKLKLKSTDKIDPSLFPRGFGGNIIADTAYSLLLSLGDDNYFRMTVWGLKVKGNLVIIGRDLLNLGFNVNLDGKNFKTTIWYGFND